MEAKKIVLDNCVLGNVVGCYKRPMPGRFGKMNKYQKIIFLAQKGLIKLYITPQVFREATISNPKKTSALCKFLKNYVTVIKFDEEKTSLVFEVVNKLIENRVFLKKNLADCLIFAESIVANLAIATDNFKDFKNFRFSKKILEIMQISASPQVYKTEQFVNEIAKECFVGESEKNNYTMENFSNTSKHSKHKKTSKYWKKSWHKKPYTSPDEQQQAL